MRVHLLLDGDGGRETGDALHIGLVETAHELPRIRTQALHITALTFSIQGVERQGRLTRTREAGDDHQLVLRNLQTDAFQVVDLRVADGDIGWFVFFQDAKIESAKVVKSGEIGEGEEENLHETLTNICKICECFCNNLLAIKKQKETFSVYFCIAIDKILNVIYL